MKEGISMVDIISDWFTKFAFETGIIGEIRQYHYLVLWIFLAAGVFACFFGFRVYQVYFSIFIFFVIAYFSSILLRQWFNWGAIVTFFAVIGIAVALLGYRWNRFGGTVICGVFGIWIGQALGLTTALAVVLGFLAAIFVILFPVIAISTISALWGAMMIADTFIRITEMGSTMILQICGVILLTVAGASVQLLLSRKQTLFEKTSPDRLTHWMENRKRHHNAN